MHISIPSVDCCELELQSMDLLFGSGDGVPKPDGVPYHRIRKMVDGRNSDVYDAVGFPRILDCYYVHTNDSVVVTQQRGQFRVGFGQLFAVTCSSFITT